MDGARPRLFAVVQPTPISRKHRLSSRGETIAMPAFHGATDSQLVLASRPISCAVAVPGNAGQSADLDLAAAALKTVELQPPPIEVAAAIPRNIAVTPDLPGHQRTDGGIHDQLVKTARRMARQCASAGLAPSRAMKMRWMHRSWHRQRQRAPSAVGSRTGGIRHGRRRRCNGDDGAGEPFGRPGNHVAPSVG